MKNFVMTEPQLACVSWNIHRAKGTDGDVRPERIADAIAGSLAPIGLDILALQEADEECRPHRSILDIERIADETGLVYQHGEDHMRWGPQSDGFLGTILFLHPRFAPSHQEVIDLPGHCHRGAVVVETHSAAHPFRVVSAHLSLSQPLRIIQMRIVGQYLRRRPRMQTILLGDFNEWRPWGGLMFSRRLVGQAFHGPSVATFPSRYPLLPLDRIMTDARGALSEVRALKSPDLRLASDHLPIAGSITLSRPA